MRRLTDEDRQFGPIRYGRSRWKAWRLLWSSGDEEYPDGNNLTLYAFGMIVGLSLPNVLRPFRIRHKASWDAATVARLGKDYWEEVHPREYGFTLSDGLFSILYGPQTNDSSTERRWSWFLPWTQWRHIRLSLYDEDGNHFRTQEQEQKRLDRFQEWMDVQESCPKVCFEIRDYDGERIIATTHIQEREWRFGRGAFRWLPWLRRNKISRSLDIRFSSEVGREKGSWKGGTIGHGIEMRPRELHCQAFRRYCALEHRSKSGPYRIRFVKQLLSS